MDIGVKVTLRRQRMFEFLDRLINIALPRVRDFRGVSLRSFDGRGNFSLGLREQIVFPEILCHYSDGIQSVIHGISDFIYENIVSRPCVDILLHKY